MFEQQMKSFRTPFFPFCMALLIFVSGTPCPVHAKSSNLEYKLKAAFILNFSKFTHWPVSAFSENSEMFEICIVGEDQFGDTIVGLESKKINGKNVHIKNLNSKEDLTSCHAVFVSKSENENIQQILQNIDGLPILTISDITNFSEQGGMFEFIPSEKKLSFIINNQQVTSNGLQVSSALLNLAEKVL